MPTPDQEISDEARKKRTIWLMAGGAASLILPLLGVAYLHISSLSGAQGPSGRNDVFERRDGGEKHLTPSNTAVPVSVMASPPPASSLPGSGRTETAVGSSLDFVKPNQDLAAKVAEPAKAPAPAAAPAPAPEAAPVAAKTPPKTAKKGGKKEFAMPKLQTSRGFTSMGGAKGGAAAAAPGGAQGSGDMQELMKNLPPGSENNPQLQQYLKSQGK